MFFFFSSRRRHTRSTRDWSSDVCSSDLERDLEPEQTGPRALVDEICARTRELRQRRFEIVDLVGDMVHPGPSLREEAADRRVLAERLEQLDATLADANRRGAHTLIFECRAVLDPRTEQPLVGLERRVEVLDRDPEMVNAPRLHASDAIR